MLAPLTSIVAAAVVSFSPPALTHGPVLGHVSQAHASIWARAEADGELSLSVRPVGKSDAPPIVARAAAAADHDRCVIFQIDGLSPDTRYTYTIDSPASAAGIASDLPSGSFKTAPPDDALARITLAIGSCAKEDAGTAACWSQMKIANPDAVVLIGDTPYIDSTDLAVQRRRYAEFAAVPAFAALVRGHPLYSTWDDHDFGRNDTNGVLKGKENSRQAFVEYHPGAVEYGKHGLGVYSSFRRGPVDVFLLDTRWFAGTEPSPFDPSKKTLLGKQQWDWLKARLAASTAPFKLITCGMIWNDAVRPGKPDYWGAYPYEREALFKFIGDSKITGCVLIGGDIHRSRVLHHDTRALAGYDLIELISSPMHDSIILTADVPHPGLIKDMGEKHTFLLLTADSTVSPPSLHAKFLNGDGKVHFEFDLHADDLRRREP